MPLYLICKRKPELAFEVLSYDKASHSAELRGRSGVVTDPHFYIDELKSDYDLTSVEPACLKGGNHAERTGV